LAILAAFDLDRSISHAWFYDVQDQWLGGGSGSWWARDVLHTGGRWFVRVIALAALLTWIVSFRGRRFSKLRRGAAFAFLALVLSTALVGSLKSVTNVDCPWDLAGFGGDRPYVELFSDRPDALPHAKCFPGAHSSSGFALIFGYFLLRDSSRRRARWALAGGFLVGVLFALGQEARGAHFLSHDLTSAGIVWFIQVLLYRAMLVPQQQREPAPVATSALQSG
jgi:membrane-associated PAP2 superfamily phosphatase